MGDAGEQDDGAEPGVFEQDAGRGAALVRQEPRARGHFGLHPVARGHRDASRTEPPFEHLDPRIVDNQLAAGEPCNGVPREIVLRRPEAARTDHGARTAQRVFDGRANRIHVVGHRHATSHRDAELREPPTEPSPVSLLRRAEQQLGANGDDLEAGDRQIADRTRRRHCHR